MEVPMTSFRASAASLMFCIMSAGAASAQTDTTGTGGGPLSTEKAPYTTVVGQTKPPSRDASPTSVKPIARRTPRQAADSMISRRICIGCGPDPATTGSIQNRPSPSVGLLKTDAELDELRALGEPRKQADLDTVALASARREQAESMQEKTNGLWRSWLVSVCDGCGDQKAARPMRKEDWPTTRSAASAAGSVDRSNSPGTARSVEAERPAVHRQATLEADLSPQNVGSIRRMPQQ
jgi:hypothetical protein